MTLIDRYICAVTELLPEDAREDVSRELRTNIEDMLPENPTESDVRNVLKKLGNPVRLAEEYSGTKKYLIGPGLYGSYISVLKLVISIVTAVMVCLTLLKWVADPPVSTNIAEMSAQFTADLLISIIQGVMQGSLWVTLVFAVLERSGVNEKMMPFAKKEWSPDDLPAMPVSAKRKIPRGETVLAICFTALFAALFYFQPKLIGLYLEGGNGHLQLIPLFVTERLDSYIPIILILATVQLGITVWKLISAHWSIPLAIANAINNIGLCTLLVVMMSDNSLFNNDFFDKAAYFTKIPLSKATTIWSGSAWAFTAVFIAICLWDSISAFAKAKS